VRIVEVSEGGHVPELKIVNEGEVPVLLLDGEELLGAKQNRIINLTILAPAHQTCVVPVSCVESGRWRHVSRGFAAAPRAQFAEGRAEKMRQVTSSLRADGSRSSDQQEVWSRIAEKSARLGAVSDTSAMSAMFDTCNVALDEFVAAFTPIERQVGAVFFVNGRAAGLELFDAPRTWRTLAPKLIRSYALEALDQGDNPVQSNAGAEAKALIHGLMSSQASVFPAVGEGADVRFDGATSSGTSTGRWTSWRRFSARSAIATRPAPGVTPSDRRSSSETLSTAVQHRSARFILCAAWSKPALRAP
jgi:ARG and Rhodanese-Phosphatase-superfamily-associated Protein domain